MRASSGVTPFRLEIGVDAIDDLRQRLRRTRWPERETVDDWSQGVPLAYLQEVCRYWAEAYDWNAAEARLNAFPQFRTTVDGIGIHFIHARSSHTDALPLIMTHGWPGSTVEFGKVIAPLIDPAGHGGDPGDAFQVVCPSLPGYGFSDKPATTGWGVEKIARAWATIMNRLGYDRYGAQGGDWGSGVSTSMAQHVPDRIEGLHLNMPLPLASRKDGPLSREDEEVYAALARFRELEGGYSISRPPGRRHLATGWSTRPGHSARGSSRSSRSGWTAPATPSTCSHATSCSTTSRCIG